MQSICKRLTIVFLIIAFALISDGYGGTVTSGGGTSVSCSDESSSSGTLEVSNTGFAGVTNSKGPIDIDETRFVDDGTHHVDINLQVDNGYVNRYITSYTPKQGGNVRSTSQVGITDTLDIANADQIIVQTNARIGLEADPSASSSVDIQVDRTDTLGAAFKGTTQAYAGKYTQATLNGYVEGALISHGTAFDGTDTVTEQGNSEDGLIKADLNLKATTRSTSVSSASKFYVDTTWDGKIQDAVDAAWDGDTIKVASGTYNENVEIAKSVAINGAGVGKTIVDGGAKGSVFKIDDATVALSGMTVTNGKADRGGGIYNAGTLTLKNVRISDNTATHGGGGIFNYVGTVNMYQSSSITGNTAAYYGGICNLDGTVNMYQGSSIAGNTANYGGGIGNLDGTVNMYQGSSIADNTANYGGGIYNEDGTVNMYKGSSIAGNTANYGGGIYNDGGTVKFLDSSGKAIATWPGYDTTKDRYGFFHTAKKQHNTPDDIYPSS